MSGELTVAEALAVVEADRARRAQDCAEAIQQALRDTRCQLVAEVVIDGRSVPVPVRIVAQ